MLNNAGSVSDLYVAFDIAKHEKLRLQDRYLFNPLAYCQKSPLVTFPMPTSVLSDRSTPLEGKLIHGAAVASGRPFVPRTACTRSRPFNMRARYGSKSPFQFGSNGLRSHQDRFREAGPCYNGSVNVRIVNAIHRTRIHVLALAPPVARPHNGRLWSAVDSPLSALQLCGGGVRLGLARRDHLRRRCGPGRSRRGRVRRSHHNLIHHKISTST